ncbi:MAG: ATP-dependent DNA ligase, partial [Burkholderiales bacterium]
MASSPARARVRRPGAPGARQRAKGSLATSRTDFDLPLDTPPMEARTRNELPAGPGWQYEPKWDGFRCLAFKANGAVELRAKSGKSLGRYFPEVVALLAGLAAPRFVLDGELVIEIDGAVSFDALQMRLHPAASRIRKLSLETPARLMLFDMLIGPDGKRVLDRPLTERRIALESFAKRYRAAERFAISACTRDYDEARRWLAGLRHGTDGVVAKRLDDPYAPGERTMVKVKHVRSADCVVGGFRYAAKSRLVGSLLLGLYDEAGKLDHVGFTSTIKNAERAALTRKLEALREPPGFTGNAPGGPSRWSTQRSGEWAPVRPVLVAEVRFDHVTGGRFRHGSRFVRWRPDKS